jgi:hypothetical protein
VFGNVEKRKSLFQRLYGVLEGLEKVSVLSVEEKLRKPIVINDLERTTLLEKVSWKQKSSVVVKRR